MNTTLELVHSPTVRIPNNSPAFSAPREVITSAYFFVYNNYGDKVNSTTLMHGG